MLSEEAKIRMTAQIALSKRLALGFALSFLPVAGFGSLAAIVIGVQARKKITASRDQLVGAGIATWCIIAGTVGLVLNLLLFWPLVVRL